MLSFDVCSSCDHCYGGMHGDSSPAVILVVCEFADTRIHVDIPVKNSELQYSAVLIDSDPPDGCPHRFEHGVASALESSDAKP